MKNLVIDIDNKMDTRQKDGDFFDDGLTDESGGCSEDGENLDGLKDNRKMSSQSEASDKETKDDGRNVESKIQRLKDNVTRTNNFLKELKALSESCQEYIPAIELEVDENGELHKERQVFIRRIVQLGAELQDAKDTVLSICKEVMPSRQWRILLDITGPNSRQTFDEDDCLIDMMSSCNLDPSVRFFGIEWERVFGKCFAISLNVKIFHQQITQWMDDKNCNSNSSTVDIILISTLLKDLSSVEADVTSHGEAVLQGRLSKSQQRLIRREQLKNCAPLMPSSSQHDVRRKKSSIVRKNSNAKGTNLQKSKSFKRFGQSSLAACRKQSEPIYKYRKNKTTNLDKLGSEINASPVTSTFRTSNEAISYGNKYNENQNPGINNAHPMATSNNKFCDKNQNERKMTEDEIYSQEMKVFDSKRIDDISSQENILCTTDDSNKHINLRRKKSSILQNVSSILKNIR